MNLKKLILAAGLSLSSFCAFANWQPYVGVGVGAVDGTFATEVSNPPFYLNYYNSGGAALIDTNSGAYHFSNTSSRLISPALQIGIANQFNKIYVGFEGSIQYDGSSYSSNQIIDSIYSQGGALLGSVGNRVVSNVNWIGSLSTQLGYFVSQNMMPYVKLGVTTTHASVNYYFDDVPDTGSPLAGNVAYSNAAPWLFGPTVSLGTQYSFTKHLRGFAEINYNRLWGSATPVMNMTQYNQSVFGLSQIDPFKQNYTFSSWSIEIGSNYYF